MKMKLNQSSITRVVGFRAVGVRCGLKQAETADLALILAPHRCSAAAIFTTNRFKAAPVLYDIALMERAQGLLQGVIINAGNANAVTGSQGLRDAESMARLTETACHLPPDSVFVMSTGIIGQPLPMPKLEAGIQAASQAIQTAAGAQGSQAAEAIMTTDLVPKEAFVETDISGQRIRIGGIAKGSGMIEPNMATMLSVLVTDAALDAPTLQAALHQAAERSFNALTVDGDTSTNDTVLLLASGEAANPVINTTNSSEFQQFVDALREVCVILAKKIAQDGEGATKLIEINVHGAVCEADAKTVAKTVANSPLVKTAMFGNDPNWGRIFMAMGRSGVPLKPEAASLRLGQFDLVQQGEPLKFDPIAAHDWLAEQREVVINIDLGLGTAQATVWTCDFSYKYVEINAEYHT